MKNHYPPFEKLASKAGIEGEGVTRMVNPVASSSCLMRGSQTSARCLVPNCGTTPKDRDCFSIGIGGGGGGGGGGSFGVWLSQSKANSGIVRTKTYQRFTVLSPAVLKHQGLASFFRYSEEIRRR